MGNNAGVWLNSPGIYQSLIKCPDNSCILTGITIPQVGWNVITIKVL